MTRKFLSAVAVMAAVFFTGSIAAEAADVTFGGQLRTRGEWWNLPANDTTFIDMRVRLNTKVKIDDNTSAFIQFQSVQRFGTTSAGQAAGTGVGTPSNVTSPSNSNSDVGVHQAYFTINKLFGAPVSLKAGRQEIVLDGHRLFGHTGWTTGAQTHDAIKFSHSEGNHTLAYFYSKVVEESTRNLGGPFGGGSTDDVDDVDVHILWGNMKGLVGENSSTSAYLVLTDIDCNSITTCSGGGFVGSQDFWTIGVRQAGGFGNISYRGEIYFQTGKSGVGVPVLGGTGDHDAYMIGLRAGYKMPDVMMKPSITLWYDQLSGTTEGDGVGGDTGGFNTLFDTGHKFYGFMDFFLAGVQPGGLHDVAIKVAAQPMAKTTIKVDLHHFARVTSLPAGNAAGSAGARTLGQEIDITAIYKYSPSTKMVLGYSAFFTRDAFGGTNAETRDWAYLMVDVKF